MTALFHRCTLALGIALLATGSTGCPSTSEPQVCEAVATDPDHPGPLPCHMNDVAVQGLAVGGAASAWVVWSAAEDITTNCVQEACDPRHSEDDADVMDAEWPSKSLLSAGTTDGGDLDQADPARLQAQRPIIRFMLTIPNPTVGEPHFHPDGPNHREHHGYPGSGFPKNGKY